MLKITIFVIILYFLEQKNSNAQIIPDQTLPINSRINLEGDTTKVNGGTLAGKNLFHSFEQFSIITGSLVWFNNAQSVENIISRITGSNVSVIDGLIRANGTANLFLLNPNGIIFGPNASLNIGGSFLATTANSIQFADGNKFSTINASQTPLLSVNLPVSLRFGMNPKPIVVQGTGHTLGGGFFAPLTRDPQNTGLKVRPTKTLALIGGELNLSGGSLIAEGGRIELGSVSFGNVSLLQTAESLTLGYGNIDYFQDIHLSQKALLDASSDSFMTNGGTIQIQGRNISLADGSLGLIQNLGLQSAGNINIRALESLTLIGTTADGKIPSSLVNETVRGKGGNISIVTKQLNLQNAGQIGTRTFSQNTLDISGNIDLSVSEAIKVIGFSYINPSFLSNISATSFLAAKAGDIQISTRQMSLVNGGFISSGTLGTGDGGNLNVTAEAINLIGINPFTLFPSSLGSSTLSIGNSGNLTINTSTLYIHDGATISASTGAYGNAGNVIINASRSIEISGRNIASFNPSSIISAAPIQPIELQQLFRLPAIPTGNSGNVIINTGHLSIIDKAQVNVRNDGPSNAGNLILNANSLFLSHQGEISASSVSGVEGDITLNIQDVLLLSNNSQITNTAAGTGNGGNIKIDTSFLIGTGNSDITANSRSGRGGAININARGALGFSVQDKRLTLGNDITAFSEQGADLSGTVELNTPEIDPSQGLIKFPETIINPTTLVAQNPCQQRRKSGLTITGRGGLPPSINENSDSSAIQVDLVEPVPSQTRQTEQTTIPTPTTPEPAQGWIFNNKGEVILTAYNPTVTESQHLREESLICPTP
ncbi:filamentous hemagglutinin N-terminal domain-containing protein [Chroococcus sp. FPU101]|uniref:two-partner secretion domain-containing protein n=1 Tax=Chroococcus sp. FPU101 TaxID=1974212 RepID=UPI001A90965C|nr:filamentous hemagglutinin N-terminal domain-containing protein [Chroococcus sp. FPU101]